MHLGPPAQMPVGGLVRVRYGLCVVRTPASLPWRGGVPWCGESWEGGRQWAAMLRSTGEETPGIVPVTQELSAQGWPL